MDNSNNNIKATITELIEKKPKKKKGYEKNYV